VRRISFWVLSTISATVLLFGFDASQRGVGTGTTPAVLSGSSSGTSGKAGTDTSRSGSSSTNDPNGTTGSSSRATSPPTATSTVTGQVAQTQWGPVQVRLTIAGGSITKVTILQYPNGNPRDVELANYSLPVLIRETIANQSAHIDMVSGATYTSAGYIQSLQSALDQADL
jgi:uncharacterized protein with FMN-binding domain